MCIINVILENWNIGTFVIIVMYFYIDCNVEEKR
jgi:hypothetical protein